MIYLIGSVVSNKPRVIGIGHRIKEKNKRTNMARWCAFQQISNQRKGKEILFKKKIILSTKSFIENVCLLANVRIEIA